MMEQVRENARRADKLICAAHRPGGVIALPDRTGRSVQPADAALGAQPISGRRASPDSARPEAARTQSMSSESSEGLPGMVRRASRSSKIAAVAAARCWR